MSKYRGQRTAVPCDQFSVVTLLLAATQILTGTGVDLDALTLLDKDRNLDDSTGLYGSRLEYVGSGIALNARLGLSDLELNEQRRLNSEYAALVGKNLNVLVLLHETEVVAQSVLADRDLLSEPP